MLAASLRDSRETQRHQLVHSNPQGCGERLDSNATPVMDWAVSPEAAMAIAPRQILDWTVDEIVDVGWRSSDNRMNLAFLANDLTTIVLAIAPELARTLQADIAQTLREPPPGASPEQT
jgi:hypothetical protein